MQSYVNLMRMSKLHYLYSPLSPLEKWVLNLESYIVIILNRPIRLPPQAMKNIWDGAIMRIAVDGGANRWFDFVNKHKLLVDNRFPDLVSGDFDSIRPDIKKMCESNNVVIKETTDQNMTDFQKALYEIFEPMKRVCRGVVAVVEFSGRLDQLYSAVSTLDRVDRAVPGAPGYLLTGNSITWLLRPGTSSIQVPAWARPYWCGLLPFSSDKSNVTTSGLKWDLCKESVEFGGLISSSNRFAADTVTVSTDSSILFTMGIDDEETEREAEPNLINT